MKKLSKFGLTLLALALPLVTSANAVGVDKPQEKVVKNYETQESCVPATVNTTTYASGTFEVGDDEITIVCEINVVITLAEDCSVSASASAGDCQMF
jgi:hypothetical protein